VVLRGHKLINLVAGPCGGLLPAGWARIWSRIQAVVVRIFRATRARSRSTAMWRRMELLRP
jgi:hypothetical protein